MDGSKSSRLNEYISLVHIRKLIWKQIPVFPSARKFHRKIFDDFFNFDKIPFEFLSKLSSHPDV